MIIVLGWKFCYVNLVLKIVRMQIMFAQSKLSDVYHTFQKATCFRVVLVKNISLFMQFRMFLCHAWYVTEQNFPKNSNPSIFYCIFFFLNLISIICTASIFPKTFTCKEMQSYDIYAYLSQINVAIQSFFSFIKGKKSNWKSIILKFFIKNSFLSWK